MKLRVACIQFNPLKGEIERNKIKIRQLIDSINKPFDLVVLPELSITGYNFNSENAISPYLDTVNNPIASNFGKELSKKYQCFTVIGLAEKIEDKIYNSCKLINPVGEILYNYHKTFLYETDEVWGASENPDKSFRSVDVILNKDYYLKNDTTKDYPTTRVNFGICMDLNPYKFEAPFNKFEFSSGCYYNRSDLIICPMAWLSPYSPSITKTTTEEKEKASREFQHFDHAPINNFNKADNIKLEELGKFDATRPDFSTINYHILRFFPFMNHKYNELPKYGPVNVITCNRTGIETDVVYGGSSSIFTFNDIPGNEEINYLNPSVDLKGYLTQGTEGVLYRELDI
ncbi:protein N-terminal amidase [[Candida] jaroonii]|uniref:Protein N-terminal amidase n=1 Tax=[Candida] jaroonii TaxID=467808 RepID=A0ACA9Y5I1_9ASCO|nr:protein N-terminal amidase [[Candida] jaroonii]